MIFNELENEYRQKSKEFLTSHKLIEYMRCPWQVYLRIQGKIEPVESAAFVLGSAVHKLVLEGRAAYQRAYAFGGPVNPTTGKTYGATTKKYLEWAQEQNCEVLPEAVALQVEKLNEAVWAHPQSSEIFAEDGKAEVVVRLNYNDTPCQARIDWFSETVGIVDLKTCDDLDWFVQDSRKYKYANQFAFYQKLLQLESGQFYPVTLVAVEKKQPYRCGIFRLTDALLEQARLENEAAMRRYNRSLVTDIWPTNFENTIYIDK